MGIWVQVAADVYSLEDAEGRFIAKLLRSADGFDPTRLRRTSAGLVHDPSPGPPGDALAAATVMEHALDLPQHDRRPVELTESEAGCLMRAIGAAPHLDAIHEDNPRFSALHEALENHLGPSEPNLLA